MNPRILVISTSPFFIVRGTPLRTRMMVEGLVKNFKVDVLTYPVGEDILKDKIKIYRPRTKFYKKTKAGPSISKLFIDMVMLKEALFLASEYDVIFCEDSESALIGSIVKKIKRKKIVCDFHNSLSDNLRVNKWQMIVPLAKVVERFMYSSADYIITNNDSFKDQLSRKFRNVCTIYDKVHNSQTNPGLRLPSRYVAYSGNSKYYQGVDLLLEAFKEMPKTFDDVWLIIMGEMDDSIKDMAKNMKRALLTGPLSIEKTNYILSRSELNVIPKRTFDSMPQMRALHYLVNGAPILATDVPSSKTFLEHKVNSYLVKPTASSIREGMVTMLSDDRLSSRIRAGIKNNSYEQDVPGLLKEIIHKI